MKFLKRLKSSNFWVSMISAVVLILQAVFNIEIKAEYLNQIIMAILGLLVMSGIVSDSSTDEVTISQSIDGEAIRENISKALTEVVTAFENSILDFVKQFEKVNETIQSTETTASSTVVNQEDGAIVDNSAILQENSSQTENLDAIEAGNLTEQTANQVASAENANQATTIQKIAKSIVHEL